MFSFRQLSNSFKFALEGLSYSIKENQNVKVQIEGHCDDRGGIQYNLALGEKRANASRKFLMDQGISGDRLKTISFGKERPLDTSSNEAAWAKNRRANFVVTSK